MSDVPSELKYTNSHEWVRSEGSGIYCIGITEHAQELLGDMVFFELPALDDSLDAGDSCAVAESVKAATDVYAPLSGKVLAINDELEGLPELVNQDPYGDGWLWRVQVDDEAELDSLLNAEQYQDLIFSESD